jgi:formate-dependent phosphoribosylglycinamide formyltransferase (GAR transformylase)
MKKILLLGSGELGKEFVISAKRLGCHVVACDSYAGGEAAMQKVQCPTLFVLGQHDQMTPPKAAQSLIGQAKNARVVRLPAGHSLMTEAPDGVLQALTDFLK